ncbi:MAG: molybdate transporter permease subunit [Caulobacteraceae bacterium]|nr:molybdate transporter permease subunit [Caulobacteraceae bacterium]
MNLLASDDLVAVLLSLKVAGVATVGALPFALGVAWLLARRPFPGRALLDAVTHLPLVLPPVATGFALLLLLGHRGWLGQGLEPLGLVFAFRWTGAALAAAVMAFPLMVRPMRQALEAIDREALEAARTLGAGPLSRFLRISLPLAAPGVVAAAVLGFARSLGEFGATITFVAAIPGETLTLPTDIYQATQTPGAESRAMVLCAISAAIALGAILLSELFIRRTNAGAPLDPLL